MQDLGGPRPPHEAGRDDAATPGRGLRIVAVGDLPAGVPAAVAPELPAGVPDLVFLAFSEIGAESIARLRPDVVISPLVAAGFDCVDLAQALVAAGFTGRYRAAGRGLPNPALVRREIAASCPGLDFDIFLVGAPGGEAP